MNDQSLISLLSWHICRSWWSNHKWWSLKCFRQLYLFWCTSLPSNMSKSQRDGGKLKFPQGQTVLGSITHAHTQFAQWNRVGGLDTITNTEKLVFILCYSWTNCTYTKYMLTNRMYQILKTRWENTPVCECVYWEGNSFYLTTNTQTCTEMGNQCVSGCVCVTEQYAVIHVSHWIWISGVCVCVCVCVCLCQRQHNQ